MILFASGPDGVPAELVARYQARPTKAEFEVVMVWVGDTAPSFQGSRPPWLMAPFGEPGRNLFASHGGSGPVVKGEDAALGTELQCLLAAATTRKLGPPPTPPKRIKRELGDFGKRKKASTSPLGASPWMGAVVCVALAAAVVSLSTVT